MTEDIGHATLIPKRSMCGRRIGGSRIPPQPYREARAEKPWLGTNPEPQRASELGAAFLIQVVRAWSRIPSVTDARGSKHRRAYWAKASLTAKETQIISTKCYIWLEIKIVRMT